MSLELGFILTGAVVVLASVSMAGFLIWLRKRETDGCNLPVSQK